MSDIDLFAENELTPIESEERAFHERVVDDVKGGIEKLASIGDASLKVLRDKRLYRASHKTFEDYCQERFGFTRQRASQKIGFLALLDDLSTRVDKAPATEGQARPLTKLPTPELQAQAWEQAQSDSGKDQPSNREVAEAVAKVQAIEAELETEKRRNQEWAAQSNQQRKHIDALERRIDLFDSEPKPEPVIKVVEKIPDDYETVKDKAAKAEQELEKLKKEQAKLVNEQVKVKLQGYQDEVNEMEKKKKSIEDIVARKQAYLDSLSSEVKRIEAHREVINGTRQELIGLAGFLSDIDPMTDADTVKRWQALAGMLEDACQSIRMVFEPIRSELTVSP